MGAFRLDLVVMTSEIALEIPMTLGYIFGSLVVKFGYLQDLGSPIKKNIPEWALVIVKPPRTWGDTMAHLALGIYFWVEKPQMTIAVSGNCTYG